jgi:hypothetical protein
MTPKLQGMATNVDNWHRWDPQRIVMSFEKGCSVHVALRRIDLNGAGSPELRIPVQRDR